MAFLNITGEETPIIPKKLCVHSVSWKNYTVINFTANNLSSIINNMNIHEELDERDRQDLINSSKGILINIDFTWLVKWIFRKISKR